MSFLPQRRKEDKGSGRVLGFFHRIFFVIGIASTVSFLLLLLTLSRLMNYAPPSLPDKILLTYTIDSDLREVAGKPSLSQPLLRPAATVTEVATALRDAAKDDRVKGLVIKLENADLSLAEIQELRSAVLYLHDAGKPTYVYSESYDSMGDYYLASAFENIWIQPVGSVGINGMAMEIPFFKGLFDKLGVTPDFAHKGAYKSAPESLTEYRMSAPHKDMMTWLITDLTRQIVEDAAKNRKIETTALRSLIDAAPFSDKVALEKKLVDHVGYYDELIETSKTSLTDITIDTVDLLRYSFVSDTRSLDKGVSGYVSKFVRKEAPASSHKDKAKIALIFASGEIVPYKGSGGSFGEGGMSASKIAAAFRTAQKDEDVAAIVLRLDSPGGAPSAAETIRRALTQARAKGKPVVVSMGSTAASGGYWIASGADTIVAQPATLTGSIGVFGGKFVMQGLFEKLGIHFDRLQEGKHAAMWSSATPFTPAEKKKFESLLGDIYDAFLDRVMEGRKMTRSQAEAVAGGRVFTGYQAHEKGLVDKLGGLDTAIAEAKTLAGLDMDTDVPVQYFPPRKSTLELFISLASDGAVLAPTLRIEDLFMSAVKDAETVRIR